MPCFAEKKYHKNQSGQAMVEFAIVFPVLFLLILTIIQAAMMYIAKEMVNYAAFCAVRSAIVWLGSEEGGCDVANDKAKSAAVIACLPISPTREFSGRQGDLPSKLLFNYDSNQYLWSWELTRVKLYGPDGGEITGRTGRADLIHKDVTASVRYKYALRIPIVDKIFYYLCSQSDIARQQRAIHGEPKKDLSLQPYSRYKDIQEFGEPFYTLDISARCTLTVEGREG